MVEIAMVLPPSSHTFDPVRMNDHQLMAGVHLQDFAPTTTYCLMKTPHIHVPQSDVDDLGSWLAEKDTAGEIAIFCDDREIVGCLEEPRTDGARRYHSLRRGAPKRGYWDEVSD